MTETQPDPQVVRVYPKGWNQGYIVAGDEADGTARVPWTNHRRDCEWAAREAEKFTGTPMEVFSDLDDGDPCWSYRPAFRKPLMTVAAVPDGQGPASLYLARDRFTGRLALWFKADAGALHFIRWAAAPGDTPAARALWDHLAATLPTITEETP